MTLAQNCAKGILGEGAGTCQLDFSSPLDAIGDVKGTTAFGRALWKYPHNACALDKEGVVIDSISAGADGRLNTADGCFRCGADAG